MCSRRSPHAARGGPLAIRSRVPGPTRGGRSGRARDATSRAESRRRRGGRGGRRAAGGPGELGTPRRVRKVAGGGTAVAEVVRQRRVTEPPGRLAARALDGATSEARQARRARRERRGAPPWRTRRQ